MLCVYYYYMLSMSLSATFLIIVTPLQVYYPFCQFPVFMVLKAIPIIAFHGLNLYIFMFRTITLKTLFILQKATEKFVRDVVYKKHLVVSTLQI